MKSLKLILLVFLPLFSSAQFYPEFVKTFHGMDGSEYLRDMDVDDEGNIYVVGYFNNTEFGGELRYANNYSRNGFLAKYNIEGDLVWFNSVNSDASSEFNLISIYQNTIYIGGYIEGDSKFISSNETELLVLSNTQNTTNLYASCDLNGIFGFVNKLGGTGFSNLSDMNVSGNGVFITGYTLSTGDQVDFTPESTPTTITANKPKDGYLVSYDLIGNYNWHYHFTGPHGDTYLLKLAGDEDNIYGYGYQGDSLLLIGSGVSDYIINSSGKLGRNLFKIKKTDGSLVWSKIISTNQTIANFTGLELEKNKLFLCGNFVDTLKVYDGNTINTIVSKNNYDGFVMRVDTNGQFNWLNQIASNAYVNLRGIKAKSNDLFVQVDTGVDSLFFSFNKPLESRFLVSNRTNERVIAKYSNSGEFINYNTYGSGNADKKLAGELIFAKNGNISIAGRFTNSINFNTPYDPTRSNYELTGERIYGATFSESYRFDEFKSIGDIFSIYSNYALGTCLDDSGNTYTVGYFEGNLLLNNTNYTSHGLRDIYVVKSDFYGNTIWVRTAGGSLNDEAVKIVFANGKLYVTGYYEGTSNFSHPYFAGILEVASAGGKDMFIWKIDAVTGLPDWIRRGGGVNDDEAIDIKFFGSQIYVTGNFRQTANFNTPSTFGSNELVSIGNSDAFLLKMDTFGNTNWLKRAGGSAFDEGTALAVNNGGIFFGGAFNGLADFNTPSSSSSNTFQSLGDRDVFISKFDHSGNLIWIQKAGGTGRDRVLSLDCSAIDVFATGVFEDTLKIGKLPLSQKKLVSKGLKDSFIFNLSTVAGTVGWFQSISSSSDVVTSSIVFNGEDVIVAGNFEGMVKFNGTNPDSVATVGMRDSFIANYNDNGDFMDFKRMGGVFDDLITGLSFNSPFFSMSGSFLGQANFNTPSTFDYNNLVSIGVTLGFTARGSSGLSFNSAFVDGGDFGGNTDILGICSDPEGNIFQTGVYTKKISDSGLTLTCDLNENYLLKANKQGKTEWLRPIYEFGYSNLKKIVTIDDLVLVTGTFIDTLAFNYPLDTSSNILVSSGVYNIFIAGFDKNTGNFQWAKKVSGTGSNNLYSLEKEGDYFYICGSFSGTLDFNSTGSMSNSLLISQGSNDGFLAKFHKDGTVQWAKRMGGDSYDIATAISIYNGDIYVLGEFEIEMNFNTPSNPTSNSLTAMQDDSDFFITKFNSSGAYQWSKRFGGEGYEESWDLGVNNTGIYITSTLDHEKPNFSNPYVAGTNEFNLDRDRVGFLAKFSLAGDFQWVNFAEANGDLEVGKINKVSLVFKDSEIIWLAEFSDTIRIRNPQTSSTLSLNPKSLSQDIFVSSFVSDGQLNWASNGNSQWYIKLEDAVFSNNAIYVIGRLEYNVRTLFDKSVFYEILPLDNYPDYLMKLSFCENGLVLVSPVDDTGHVTLTKMTDNGLQASNKITENASVQYRAQFLELLPGFKADSGTFFIGETGGCN